MSPPTAGPDGPARPITRRRLALVCGSLLLLALAALALTTEISLDGESQGIYLLRGSRKLLEVKTDLFLDEEQRLLFGISWEIALPLRKRARFRSRQKPPFLEYVWSDAGGSGFVVSHLGGEKLLLVNWSRYLDDEGKTPDGLFLGGSLPYPINREGRTTQSDSGMAYFDGRQWYHAWCSVNELVAPARQPSGKIRPSDWDFLGSTVLAAAPDHLLITSRHRIHLDGEPVLIQKWVSLRAGDLFFTMATRFENEGSAPVSYLYLYGDEPWVGNYGSSRGNVGWTRTGLVNYEGFVDTRSTDVVGYYDIGNTVIGERGPFTGTANFLQWLGPSVPELVFFTNMTRPLQPPWNSVPLSAERSRALFLQWGPQVLPPQGVKTYLVATGVIPPRHWPAQPASPVVKLDPLLLKALAPRVGQGRPAIPNIAPEDVQVVPFP